MRRFSNFIAGAFCGALIGAVTALLLAPSSGDELRSRARERAEGFRKDVLEAYNTRMAQLETELASLRGRPLADEE